MNRDVVSLETARRLRESGWKQDERTTWHYWWSWAVKGPERLGLAAHLDVTDGKTLAAPTAGELLEELPPYSDLVKHSMTYSDSFRELRCESERAADALGDLWREWQALKKREA